MGFYIDLGIDNKYYTSTFVEEWGGHEKRGCCIRSPLATEISVTSNKIRPQIMKMALSKMLISSKIMHGYCCRL